MYGTVARFKIKPGMKDRLMQLAREHSKEIPGLVGEYVYQMDSDPNEFYMAVVFESKEKYWANAKSPEQDARYRKLAELFAAEPEWHDGEIVDTGKSSGSTTLRH